MRGILALTLLLPALAHATDTTLSHQGRLLGSSGEPFNGALPVLVRVMDHPDIGQGAHVASVNQTVTFADGYFQVEVPGLTGEALMGDRWISIQVDGQEFPRQPLMSVPYAVRSTAVTLSDVTATCDATTTSLHGTLRYHNDGFEGCTSGGWKVLETPLPFSAQGGVITETGGYRIHTFTSGGTFSVDSVAGTVDVMVVAGGGGGGGRSGGGGGAGGVLVVSDLDVGAGETFAVTIGGGGAGGTGSPDGYQGANGANTLFGALTAFGGGGGGSDLLRSGTSGNPNIGRSGGSGGGGRYGNNGGSGVSGQGYDGGFGYSNPYAGGGGGGAGGVGVAGTSGGEIGDGGPGRLVDFSGTPTYYGGGGGGGSHNPANGRGYGGIGGGGTGGAPNSSQSGAAGEANTGGGGGAGSTTSGGGGSGGSGGSGIVIVRYPIPS